MNDQLESLQWHPFRNDDAAAVPAYGLIKLTGIYESKGLTVLLGEQPDGSDAAYAVNGPWEVPAGKYGKCLLVGPCIFAYDTGTPTANDFYDAKSGQWTANKTGSLIRCMGIIDATNKFALGILNSGAGDSSVRCFAKLSAAASGSVAKIGVYNVTSISGANPTTLGLSEEMQAWNILGRVGAQDATCIITKVNEAYDDVAAGDFVIEDILCGGA